MPQTRRAQILMEPEEYQRIEEIARRQHVSVSELFRNAVRTLYFSTRSDKQKAVDALGGMQLEMPELSELKSMLLEAKNGGLH